MELVTFDRSLETLQGPIGRAIDGSRSAAFTRSGPALNRRLTTEKVVLWFYVYWHLR
jgi:hypothetical protein